MSRLAAAYSCVPQLKPWIVLLLNQLARNLWTVQPLPQSTFCQTKADKTAHKYSAGIMHARSYREQVAVCHFSCVAACNCLSLPKARSGLERVTCMINVLKSTTAHISQRWKTTGVSEKINKMFYRFTRYSGPNAFAT